MWDLLRRQARGRGPQYGEVRWAVAGPVIAVLVFAGVLFVGLAELIRRAVDRTYGQADADAFARALEESFGAWGQDDLDGERFVDSIRGARSDRFAEW